jgi:SecD/SecF fusion protein
MPWSSLATLFAQATPSATPPAGPWYNAVWFLLAVAVATLVVPYLVGNAIAKSLRMPDYGWKIGLILIALTAGVVIDVSGWPPKRGIDLSGGVKLVYEIDQEKLQEVNVDEILHRVVDEANKAGAFPKDKQAKVTTPSPGTIEVRLQTTDPDSVQKVKAALASLDLSGLSATLSGPQSRQEDQQTVLEYQAVRSKNAPDVDMEKLIKVLGNRINPGGQHEVAIRKLGADQIEIDIPDVDQTEIALIKRNISTAGALEFHIIADTRQGSPDADIVADANAQKGNPSNDVSNGETIVGRWVGLSPEVEKKTEPFWDIRTTKSGIRQVLMLTDGYGVTGGNLTSARTGFGVKGPQVEFNFDSVGANKFGQLTEQNLPTANSQNRWLGIVLDGQLMSAATIQSKITYSGEITGDLPTAEVDFIVGVLNAGALPAALKKDPVSQEDISAELGRDTIHSSAMAMIVSSLSVLVFMLFYYRFAGIVADAAVLFNLLLVLAFMIMLKAAFTLAGLAGLVLSIGMAVDSNVLIYERMREEKERGAALRMVIRNGFGRAMATIIDMHSTTIITGLVLYFIGTEQLRGFAVTLVLGLLVNLFTAVFCARVVFDVAERQRWLTKLKMLRLFGDTKIDFVRIMVPAIIVSIVISVLGVACAWHRSLVGPGMFDTDFTGGTVVQIVLKNAMNDADVRKLVEGDEKLPDSTVVAVEGKENHEFIIRTSNQEPQQVKDDLVALFNDKLQNYGVHGEVLTDLHSIAATKPAEAEPKGTEPKGAAPKGTEPKGAEPKGTEPKASEPKISAPNGGDKKGADSKGTSSKTDEPKTKDSKSKDSKSNAGKSSGLPADGPRLSPLVNALLTVTAGPDAFLFADPPPATPSPDTKSGDTKKPDATPPTTTPPTATPPTTTPPTTTPPTTTPPTTTPPTTTPPTTNTLPSSLPPSNQGSGEATGGSMFSQAGAATDAEAFAGGTETTLNFAVEIPYASVASLVTDALGVDVRFELANPKYTPGDKTAYKTWTLRVALPRGEAEPRLKKFADTLAKMPAFKGVSNIGGRVAKDTKQTALAALVASIAMIVVYIWIRFQNVIYGIGAVVALIHDVFITVAALAISSYVAPYLGFALVEPFKISLNVVAAILTICGYSISDTIVIFDRIREVRGKSPDLTPEIINLSVNQTLSRTVLTVFTVLLVTTILYTSGGQAIHAFAFTMLVGLISGTYSSVYIAAPCLLWMRGKTNRGTTRIQ